MRAVVYDRYGPPEVLQVADVERPVLADDQVLVKVHASTVNRTDCGMRSATPFFIRVFTGLRRPKRRILGMEFAGDVEAVGSAVGGFEVGDRVFGVKGSGAYAELVAVREGAAMAHMPGDLTYAEAAAVCDGACSALSCLRDIELRPGRSILVYGASGSIGSAAVQLADYFGADVTAVCNAKNVELVRSLGADHVIDYTQEDFTKSRKTYDVVLDAVGKLSFGRCRSALKPGGIYVATDGLRNVLWHLWTRRLGDKRARMGIARYKKADVLFLRELIEAGRYRAVIDRAYPLEAVVEATAYVETGQKTGNVVLSVSG
jgi:NADPH:quinone reductase-like Zn-dependent oxidoreductase